MLTQNPMVRCPLEAVQGAPPLEFPPRQQPKSSLFVVLRADYLIFWVWGGHLCCGLRLFPSLPVESAVCFGPPAVFQHVSALSPLHQRRGQRLRLRPPEKFHPLVHRVVGQPRRLGPSLQTVRVLLPLSPVCRLLDGRGPPAVIRGVVPIVVYTINGVLRGRSFAKVLTKMVVPPPPEPAVAHFNAASAVVAIDVGLWVVTAGADAHPDPIHRHWLAADNAREVSLELSWGSPGFTGFCLHVVVIHPNQLTVKLKFYF